MQPCWNQITLLKRQISKFVAYLGSPCPTLRKQLYLSVRKVLLLVNAFQAKASSFLAAMKTGTVYRSLIASHNKQADTLFILQGDVLINSTWPCSLQVGCIEHDF